MEASVPSEYAWFDALRRVEPAMRTAVAEHYALLERHLHAKSHWCYREVMARHGSAIQPREVFDQWQTESLRDFYLAAAQQSEACAKEPQRQPATQRVIYAAWHFPGYPALLRQAQVLGCHVLVAARAPWICELITPDRIINFRDGAAEVKRLLHLLRLGVPIACMLDYCYDGSKADFLPFLGMECRTPVGLLQLAATYAYTLEVCALAEGHLECLHRCSLADGPRLAAEQYNNVVSDAILADPGRWLLWPSLDRRWAPGYDY